MKPVIRASYSFPVILCRTSEYKSHHDLRKKTGVFIGWMFACVRSALLPIVKSYEDLKAPPLVKVTLCSVLTLCSACYITPVGP